MIECDLNGLLRILCFLARKHCFLFWIDHIAGERNTWADALSRTKGSTAKEQRALGVQLAEQVTECVDVVNDLLRTFLKHASEMRSFEDTKQCECMTRSAFMQLCCNAQDEVF